MQAIIKEFQLGQHTVTLETGAIARQADGAVLASIGDTSVLVTVVGKREAQPGQDFFPLTVNYQERMYAAGRIPGGFLKREGRPNDGETLIARLIDRPIRPLFPDGFVNEVQVIATVVSVNPEIQPDMVAMIGTSAALAISGIPFNGPIGASRVGFINGEYVLNPTLAELEESQLDLVVAGTDNAVLMVESEAKELNEDLMLGAVLFGHQEMKAVIEACNELKEKAGNEIWNIEVPEDQNNYYQELETNYKSQISEAFKISIKSDRNDALREIRNQIQEQHEDLDEMEMGKLMGDFKKLEKDIVRGNILNNQPRIDGRDLDTVRPIFVETDVLPGAHGSALFTRGETQAIVVATLGSSRDAQRIESIEGEGTDNFMLHYNFPAYSVGEIGMPMGPKRREIGHGNLAKRAIKAVLPDVDEFGYTMRVVSEITESNGSSSMATVCGTSLALMDAGVPLKDSVAGIAMGLILEKGKYSILSDILGDEDHLGDMDFKVAGTKAGVTSLQMDIKVRGITFEIMEKALSQAKAGREHILNEMSKAIKSSRETLSKHTPKMETIKVDKKDIATVIGKGGTTIRDIVEKSGAKVEVKDTGDVIVAAPNDDIRNKAIEMIKALVAKPEMGKIYKGKVVKIMEFGAFVNFLGNQDGLVHISQLAKKRVAKVEDVVKEGDEVSVKVIGFDRGKVKLSIKEAL